MLSSCFSAEDSWSGLAWFFFHRYRPGYLMSYQTCHSKPTTCIPHTPGSFFTGVFQAVVCPTNLSQQTHHLHSAHPWFFLHRCLPGCRLPSQTCHNKPTTCILHTPGSFFTGIVQATSRPTKPVTANPPPAFRTPLVPHRYRPGCRLPYL
jgi:hypothetical protein